MSNATVARRLSCLPFAWRRTVSPYTRFRPGLIHTPMTDVAQSRFDMLLVEGFNSINRWCRPEDVGRAVATMAAGELPFTTGTAI